MWSNDLDEVWSWAHGVQFFLESLWKTWVKGGTTGEDDVAVEVLSDINITGGDGLISHLVESQNF